VNELSEVKILQNCSALDSHKFSFS